LSNRGGIWYACSKYSEEQRFGGMQPRNPKDYRNFLQPQSLLLAHAFCASGITSRSLPFLVRNLLKHDDNFVKETPCFRKFLTHLRHSFISPMSLLRSYMLPTNLSLYFHLLRETFHAAEAHFSPFLLQLETTSQPVIAWYIGSASATS